jgi:hypothetical protein
VDRSAASDASGLSTIRSLQPGTYSVTAHASGFSEYKVASLTAQVALSVTENVKLRALAKPIVARRRSP